MRAPPASWRTPNGARVLGFDDLLAAETVDAVVVSTPTHVHADQVTRALRAGKHVLCEKPLAPTSTDCARMVEAAQQANCQLATGFDYRHFAAVRFLKSVLDDGGIGELDHVRAFGGHDGMANFRAPWMFESATGGGGAAMDIGLHLTDSLRFLFGELQVEGSAATNQVWDVAGSEDNVVAICRTESGAPVAYHATWSEWRGFHFSIEAYGSEGMAAASYAPMANVWIRRRQGAKPATVRKRYIRAILEEKFLGWEVTTRRAFAAEIADLMRRAQGETVLSADGRDGARAVEIAEELRRLGGLG